ncbi:hypothetical protein CH371_01565 [Leptospira wolffii]|uniref:Uncharacterized protein n=1 Tax=Leptospira wolffii TaxID=409998 RepID=A0A2M9ZEH6_9LEPT|nr:hypothetical protein CH371_01565 [Leptospira wolffii]
MRHTVNHSRQKSAKEAAQKEGSKNKPLKHERPKNGDDAHYHAAENSGKKFEYSTHHKYPSK